MIVAIAATTPAPTVASGPSSFDGCWVYVSTKCCICCPTWFGDVPVRCPRRRRNSSTMLGSELVNALISWLKTGTIRAIKPPSAPNPSSRPSTAPIALGTRTRCSRLANADSGVAMITTISTASTSVMSCSKINPATTSPNARSTAR